MASFHGKNGVVKVGANAVLEVKKFSAKTTAAVADNTAMGDDWKTHIPGQTVNSWTAAISGNYDQGNALGQAALVPGASVTVSLFPEGSPTGAHYLTGTGTVIDDSVDADMSSAVQRSFSVEGNGPLTWAVMA